MSENKVDVVDIHDTMYKLKGHSSSKETLYNVFADEDKYREYKTKCYLPSIRREGDRIYAKPVKKEFTSASKYYLVYLFFTKNNVLMADYSSPYVLIPKKGFMVCLRIDASASISAVISRVKSANQRINGAYDNANLAYMTNLNEFTYEIINEDEYMLFLNKSSKNYSTENKNFEAQFFNLNNNDFGKALDKVLKNA